MVVCIIIGLSLTIGFSIAFVFVANTLTMYSDVGNNHSNFNDLSEEPMVFTVKEDKKKDLSHIG